MKNVIGMISDWCFNCSVFLFAIFLLFVRLFSLLLFYHVALPPTGNGEQCVELDRGAAESDNGGESADWDAAVGGHDGRGQPELCGLRSPCDVVGSVENRGERAAVWRLGREKKVERVPGQVVPGPLDPRVVPEDESADGEPGASPKVQLQRDPDGDTVRPGLGGGRRGVR